MTDNNRIDMPKRRLTCYTLPDNMTSVAGITQEDQTAACRRALEEEIAVHTGAIIQLKYRLNTMAPISKLPPEVLSEIFTHIAVAHYAAVTPVSLPMSHRPSHKWVTFSHVCRTWRTIALNTPRLWSRVVLSDIGTTEEILARSKQAPLYFNAALNHNDARIRLLDRVINDAQRLKELHLSIPMPLLLKIWTGWTTQASILESLSITATNRSHFHFELYDIVPQTFIMPVLFSGCTPSLRILKLRGVPIGWNNPIFCTTLTRLHIASESNMFQPGNFSHLLTALENMPLLQSLILHRAIPSLAGETTKIPTAQRTVSLSRLRTLDVTADDIDTANLINHLSLPACPRIILHGRLERGIDDLSHVLANTFAHSNPFLTAKLYHNSPHPASIRCWRTADLPTSSPPDFELDLALGLGLHFIQNILANATWLAQVQRLVVHPSLTHAEWEALFTRMPKLRDLSLTANPNPAFLHTLSAIPLLSGLGGIDGGPETLVAPNLSNMNMCGVRFNNPRLGDDAQQFMEKFIDWLVLRCTYNVPIERLDLSECLNTGHEDIDRLREYVPYVEWDGDEYFESEWDDDEDMNTYDEDDDYSDFEDDIDFPMPPFEPDFYDGHWFH